MEKISTKSWIKIFFVLVAISLISFISYSCLDASYAVLKNTSNALTSLKTDINDTLNELDTLSKKSTSISDVKIIFDNQVIFLNKTKETLTSVSKSNNYSQANNKLFRSNIENYIKYFEVKPMKSLSKEDLAYIDNYKNKLITIVNHIDNIESSLSQNNSFDINSYFIVKNRFECIESIFKE